MNPLAQRSGTVSAMDAMRYEGPDLRDSVRRFQGCVQVWDAEAIDALTETVVTRLLVERQTARAVANELAARLSVDHPLLPALSLALPFTLAAAAIEDMLGGGTAARNAALDAWRIAALIGADALLLRNGDAGDDTLAGLWSSWQAGDEVFGDEVFGAGKP
ncbi:MAG: hypothetical protein ACK4GT_04070 [Pararhodobacter sp.]